MKARKYLRIATRKSPLAYCQANAVKAQLKKHYPFMQIELFPIVTEGDRHLDSPLNKLGGKGLFVKELEKALRNGDADIAVHSMKDVPMHLAEGLVLAAICEREDARDVLISRSGKSLKELIAGSCIGSSSLRRQSQLLALRPDLTVKTLRGNVGTRLEKLAAGAYDAIILAAAGLIRLKNIECVSEYLESNYFLPAPGQGALGVESRADDSELLSCLAILNHKSSQDCVMAERALSRQLGGSCQIPLAAYAECLPDAQLRLRGLVAKPDGSKLVKVEKFGSVVDAEKLGADAAKELLSLGADTILQDLL